MAALLHGRDLRPATPEDVAETLAYALRFSGKKRAHDANEYMAATAATRLVEHWSALTSS